MAKKNGRDDPPKPQVAENEQMSDIILILEKPRDFDPFGQTGLSPLATI